MSDSVDSVDMWPSGGITQIVGDSCNGKTTVIIRRANEAVAAGKKVYFSSSEMTACTLLEKGLSRGVTWLGGGYGEDRPAWLRELFDQMQCATREGILVVDFARYPSAEELALLSTPNPCYHFMSAFCATASDAQTLVAKAMEGLACLEIVAKPCS